MRKLQWRPCGKRNKAIECGTAAQGAKIHPYGEKWHWAAWVPAAQTRDARPYKSLGAAQHAAYRWLKRHK